MLLIALSCLLIPALSWILVKLLTPVPPTQFQVVVQASFWPLSEVMDAQSEPDVAPERPH